MIKLFFDVGFIIVKFWFCWQNYLFFDYPYCHFKIMISQLSYSHKSSIRCFETRKEAKKNCFFFVSRKGYILFFLYHLHYHYHLHYSDVLRCFFVFSSLAYSFFDVVQDTFARIRNKKIVFLFSHRSLIRIFAPYE